MGIDPSTNFVVHLLMKVPKRDDFAQKWPRKYFFLTMDTISMVRSVIPIRDFQIWIIPKRDDDFRNKSRMARERHIYASPGSYW